MMQHNKSRLKLFMYVLMSYSSPECSLPEGRNKRVGGILENLDSTIVARGVPVSEL